MWAELTKRSKPEDLAGFAVPGKREGDDDELLLHRRRPQLQALVWHLEGLVFHVAQSLGQGSLLPIADLAVQHRKSTTH